MDRVLFINPPIREFVRPNCVPTGLGYLASVLQKNGYVTSMMDINGYRRDADTVEKMIKYVGGVEVVCITGLITQYSYVKWLTDVIRWYHPHALVIVGGCLGTSIPDILLKHTETNVVIMGEGEEILPQILKDTLPSGCKAVFDTRLTPIKNLDSLPFPAYDLFPMHIYLANPIGYLNKRKWVDGHAVCDMKSINIISSRGCPFNCHFCFSHYLGQGYRQRSVGNIIDEIKMLQERYGVGYVHFNDEFAFASKKRTEELCKEMSKLDIIFGGACRIDTVNEEMLRLLADSGCRHLGFGIESLSQHMLDSMNKKIRVETIMRNLPLAKKIIEDIDTSFILGFPGETHETIKETMGNLKKLNIVPNAVFMATPYPGTWLYDYAVSNGYIKDEIGFIEGLGEQSELHINFTKDISDEELKHYQEIMLKGGILDGS